MFLHVFRNSQSYPPLIYTSPPLLMQVFFPFSLTWLQCFYCYRIPWLFLLYTIDIVSLSLFANDWFYFICTSQTMLFARPLSLLPLPASWLHPATNSEAILVRRFVRTWYSHLWVCCKRICPTDSFRWLDEDTEWGQKNDENTLQID